MNVIDIAKYIVTQCTKTGKPVSNLKLQQMLYFMWLAYYGQNNAYLFEEEFCAQRMGLIIPKVYLSFCQYAGRPIIAIYDVNIAPADRVFLDRQIVKYLPYSMFEISAAVKKEGRAWARTWAQLGDNGTVSVLSLVKDALNDQAATNTMAKKPGRD